MTKAECFSDWLNINECYRKLQSYKEGNCTEKDCLVFIAKKFQDLEEK